MGQEGAFNRPTARGTHSPSRAHALERKRMVYLGEKAAHQCNRAAGKHAPEQRKPTKGQLRGVLKRDGHPMSRNYLLSNTRYREKTPATSLLILSHDSVDCISWESSKWSLLDITAVLRPNLSPSVGQSLIYGGGSTVL